LAVSAAADAAVAAAPIATSARAATSAGPALLEVSPDEASKRSASEEQWSFAKQTRKAAKRRLDEASSLVQHLAVERAAVVQRLDRQHAAPEKDQKDAKRRLNRATVALRSVSE